MMAAKSVASTTPGTVNEKAGLTLTKAGVNNPSPIQHGPMGQAERAFSAASTFLSGVLAISASQFIGAPLKLVDPKFYDAYMSWTKESFAVLMTTITQWWAPTVVRVSGDESMKGQLYQMDDGTLKCNFPHRLILMANHQLYTDWLYLWWIAYTNKMHGRIYIILKESLKNLPIVGWGAQFYNFIFLSRKWETDRWRFRRAFSHLQNPQDPMWLLIFPEGTNLSGATREKSAAWAKKTGIPDMKNQLLPRTTGLQFCLQELKKTTNWLYDCTIAYEGVPKGQYGQDVFTLKSSFFEGRPPKSVNMYWRRYKIADIPCDHEEAFGRWLTNRWREKDYILEYFYKFNRFPADDAIKALAATEDKREPNHAKAITTEVKGGGWDEFLSIFGPITTAAGALSSVDMTEPINFDALLTKVVAQQHMNLLDISKAPIGATSQEAIRKALKAAQASNALPKPVIDQLIKEAPTTQQAMQQALLKAGQKTGDPEMAKRAAQAPASKAQVSTKTKQNAAKVAHQAQQSIAKAAPASKAGSSLSSIPVGGEASNIQRKATGQANGSPAAAVRKAMPLANLEATITRPISTLAVQTAAAKVHQVAAQRAKRTGAALPGQQAAAKTPTRSPASLATGPKPQKAAVARKAASTTGVSTAADPAKATGVGGQRVKFSKPVPLTAANLQAANSRKSAGSKPIGTQKYVNGRKG
ncbi:Acyltransferase C-terminus [Teratosphaeria destructans]|uniref:Acyltransferase C-terminus n=1 Tax=Teratosphaeria destructans TaxID=418781 RepID=A0A9W7VYP6_9PEZI|nr:Acyltransferase C-terminus [Teratosphaeria destructans]